MHRRELRKYGATAFLLGLLLLIPAAVLLWRHNGDAADFGRLTVLSVAVLAFGGQACIALGAALLKRANSH